MSTPSRPKPGRRINTSPKPKKDHVLEALEREQLALLIRSLRNLDHSSAVCNVQPHVVMSALVIFACQYGQRAGFALDVVIENMTTLWRASRYTEEDKLLIPKMRRRPTKLGTKTRRNPHD